jgi:PadR family transcriptional regulator PadR
LIDHFETEMRRPREFLTLNLLLLLAESPGHGYQLMERLKPLGFDWNGPGPIYRELRSLEDDGLVESQWVAGKTGPGRRVYEITASGRGLLDRSVDGVAGLQGLIGEYLVRFRALAAPQEAERPAKPRPAGRARTPRRALARRDGARS